MGSTIPRFGLCSKLLENPFNTKKNHYIYGLTNNN